MIFVLGTSPIKKSVVITATDMPTSPKVGEICIVTGAIGSTDRGLYVCFEDGTWIQVF